METSRLSSIRYFSPSIMTSPVPEERVEVTVTGDPSKTYDGTAAVLPERGYTVPSLLAGIKEDGLRILMTSDIIDVLQRTVRSAPRPDRAAGKGDAGNAADRYHGRRPYQPYLEGEEPGRVPGRSCRRHDRG